jgi:hypothetical protein
MNKRQYKKAMKLHAKLFICGFEVKLYWDNDKRVMRTDWPTCTNY